jgi:hypothetical protein
MEPHSHHPEDLSELEHRLSAWRPADEGLNADAVLFAAGRASVRLGPARFVWPALTVCLAGLAVVLGVCLNVERSERLALARQLRQPPPAPAPKSAPSIEVSPVELPPAEDVPPTSFLAAHRLLERGLDDWPERVVVARVETPAPALPHTPVLQVGQRDLLLDP